MLLLVVLFIGVPILSLLATMMCARRAPRFRSMFRGRFDRVAFTSGMIFYVLGFVSTIVPPGLVPKDPTLWYLPSLGLSELPGPSRLIFMLTVALAWLLGSPLAAAGLRAALAFAVIVLSAGIVTNHVGQLIPEAPDELLIGLLTLVQIGWGFEIVSDERIGTSTTCQRCGYDLSPTPDTPCPECGTAYATATIVRTRRLAPTPKAMRIARGWAIAGAIAAICPAVGMVAAIVGYRTGGTDWASALQLAQQYHFGNSFRLAWPLALAGAAIVVLYHLGWNRRAWVLIPLGVAASFALRLFI